MRDEVWHDWDDVADVLRDRACEGYLGLPSGRLAADDSTLRIVCGKVLRGSGGVWDDDAQARIVDALLEARGSSSRAWDPHLPTLMRCRRNAWLALCGRGEDIPRPERDQVRAALEASDGHAHLARSVPPVPPYDGDGTRGPVTVGFLHTYVQAGPSGRGARTTTAATSYATLPRVAPADAPVVCMLKPVEGSVFPLRLVDGALMRPVMAPGGWRPVGLDEFREAAARGWAWADNPFLPRAQGTESVAAVRDLASAPSRAHASDAARLEAAADGCLRRAGPMCVIDGVVHRRTEEPTLHLAVREAAGHDGSERDWRPRGFARLAWRLGGDVDMFSTMRPDRVTSAGPVRDVMGSCFVRLPEPRGFDGGRGRRGVTVTHVYGLGTSYGFSLGDGEALAQVARIWVGFDRANGRPNPRFRDDLPCVSDLDPVRFAPTPGAATAALLRHARSVGGAWEAVAGLGPDPSDRDGTVDACVILRDVRTRLGERSNTAVGIDAGEPGSRAVVLPLTRDGLDQTALEGAAAMCEAAARELEADLVHDDEAVASLSL